MVSTRWRFIFLTLYYLLLNFFLQKLNLYDLEDIGKRLQAVKHTVQSGNSNDSSNCNAVLNNFHSACDPSSESCSSANQQSFQGRALLLASWCFPIWLTHIISNLFSIIQTPSYHWPSMCRSQYKNQAQVWRYGSFHHIVSYFMCLLYVASYTCMYLNNYTPYTKPLEMNLTAWLMKIISVSQVVLLPFLEKKNEDPTHWYHKQPNQIL